MQGEQCCLGGQQTHTDRDGGGEPLATLLAWSEPGAKERHTYERERELVGQTAQGAC